MSDPKLGDLRISYHPDYEIYYIERCTHCIDYICWTENTYPIEEYKTLDEAKQALTKEAP